MKNCGSGILFMCGSDLLLLKKTSKDVWDIPGGKKKEDESYLEAAKRETIEEIGQLPEFKKIGHYVHETNNNKFKIYYAKVPNKFKCKLSKEHSDYEWFYHKNLPQNLHVKVAGAIDFIQNALFQNVDKNVKNWFTSY